MAESKADLLLHPVRIRIVQCLAGGQTMTTQQIKEVLADVPQATIYRHIQKLEKAQIIEAVEEHQIRGAIEKIYALKGQEGNFTPSELGKMTDEQHMELFTKFVSNLLGDFRRYLDQPSYDLFEDGVSFRQLPVYVTDEEFSEMITKLRNLYHEYMSNKPAPERRRRTFTTIILPDPKKENYDA